ncbi:MAG TPA: MFS transporter [Myxococcota bacterium]|nr:MFS transporter [Myxococcota bacterium]
MQTQDQDSDSSYGQDLGHQRRPAQQRVAGRIVGTPRRALALGTWGFFVGFAAVALYGPASHAFERQMGLSGFTVGLLVAAPQLTGSLLRIPFGAWVDSVGGRRPMLVLLGLSALGMAGLTSLLFFENAMSAALYPLVLFLGFLSGCGVATFSVGVPQVSYWHRRRVPPPMRLATPACMVHHKTSTSCPPGEVIRCGDTSSSHSSHSAAWRSWAGPSHSTTQMKRCAGGRARMSGYGRS